MKRTLSMFLTLVILLSVLFTPQIVAADGQTKWLHGIPNFKQYDSRWKSTYIGTKTIGSVGCLVTSMAMSESYRQGTTITPAVMRNKLSFNNNDMRWPSNYSTISNGLSLQKIYNTINQGKPCIVGAKNSNGWHWVIVTGYVNLNTGNMQRSCFQINDPNSTSRTNLAQFLSVYPNNVTIKTYSGAGKGSTVTSNNSSSSKTTVASLLGSKTCKGYILAASNQKAYKNAALSSFDNSYIYPSDYVTVIKVSGNSVLLRYPVSNGTKDRWVAASKVFCNFGYSVWNTKATTYIQVTSRPGGGVSVGTIYPSDQVYVLGVSGSYYQVLYPASGSTWKFGFIPKSSIK